MCNFYNKIKVHESTDGRVLLGKSLYLIFHLYVTRLIIKLLISLVTRCLRFCYYIYVNRYKKTITTDRTQKIDISFPSPQGVYATIRS